jgi:electron transfer flavoprotein alpha/beta subunit
VAALPAWWERHEMVVHLAFDFQDLRAAEEAVRIRERRVEELEEELRALGVGTEDTDEEDEEGEGEVAALAARLAGL